MAQLFTDAEQAVSALRRCSDTKSLSDGRRVHNQIISSGLHHHRFLSNLLIQMYGKCGSLQEAQSVFDKMPSRNTFTWSILLSAYAHNGHHTQALEVYGQMESQRIKPHRTTMATAITACAASGNLSKGKLLHSRASFHGLKQDVLVSNSLISMYGRCSSLAEAESVFESQASKDSATWNSMICAYSHNGRPRRAMDLYTGMPPGLRDSITYVSALEACGSLQDLELGRSLDADVSGSDFRDDLVVGTARVSMYGRCRSLTDSLRCFETMPVRNTVTWNALITVYARNGEHAQVVVSVRRMDQQGYKPNPITFLGLIEAVSKAGSLSEGRKLQERVECIPDCSLTETVSMGNALITMYGKLGSPEEARDTFGRLRHHRSVISWTALFTGFAQNGRYREALESFREMVTEDGVRPDSMAYASVLGAASNVGDVSSGKEIHEMLASDGLPLDSAVGTALLTLYGKSGRVPEAESVFQELLSSGMDDLPSRNAMLLTYAHNGHLQEAMNLYKKIPKPDPITLVTILSACSASPSPNRTETGREIHSRALELGYQSDESVVSALIGLYGKSNSLQDARTVFRGMRSTTTSVIVWNSMLTALSNGSCYSETLALFREMDLEGVKPSETTFTGALVACVGLGEFKTGRELHERIAVSGMEMDPSLRTTLIGLYGKGSCLREAEELYAGMAERDVFSASAMIGAYVENGEGDKGIRAFAEMDLEGIEPDQVAFISVLSACSSLSQGRFIHVEILASGRDYLGEGSLGTALACMYARCGSLETSRRIFDGMTRRDTVSWSAMITAFAQHGEEARILFQTMVQEGIEPESPTFTSMLFSYCHGGVVDRAQEFFLLMVGEFGVEPTSEHYCCVVNLLGRAGRVREADDLVQNMPYEPDYVPWMTLLGACNTHGSSLRQGTEAAQGILQTGTRNSGTFVLLSSLLSSKS